ncbi:hypothetical protein [Scytonema sp. NUACC26]|uniref:hypothetical protein n=1 Tax=Scytonema sp. NUACC26 TaxID=3140176 RepID=UPI0034DC4E4B
MNSKTLSCGTGVPARLLSRKQARDILLQDLIALARFASNTIFVMRVKSIIHSYPQNLVQGLISYSIKPLIYSGITIVRRVFYQVVNENLQKNYVAVWKIVYLKLRSKQSILDY